MEPLEKLLEIFIIHYTPLRNRREFLERNLPEIPAINWLTEDLAEIMPLEFSDSRKVFGVSPRLIGMDLGINSRSLTRSRRIAKLEGYQLLIASYLHERGESLVASQIQARTQLPKGILDNLKQHALAIYKGAKSKKPYILILEDDASPSKNTWLQMEEYLNLSDHKRLLAFLGSGADLTRTSSDRSIDKFGLFSTGTYCSRTAVATLYSRDVLERAQQLISKYGTPDWMPIDYVIQALARKMRIKTIWQDPPWFEQGSETGLFKSSLR